MAPARCRRRRCADGSAGLTLTRRRLLPAILIGRGSILAVGRIGLRRQVGDPESPPSRASSQRVRGIALTPARRGSDCAHYVVFAALAVSHWMEAQTGWSVMKFVPTARRYRTVYIMAGRQILTAGPVSVQAGRPQGHPGARETRQQRIAHRRGGSEHTSQFGESIAIERQRQTTLSEQHRRRVVRSQHCRESRHVAGTGRRRGVRLERVMAAFLGFPARTGARFRRDALRLIAGVISGVCMPKPMPPRDSAGDAAEATSAANDFPRLIVSE